MFLIIFFFISQISFAQSPFKAGIFSGITTTQIDGDGYSGFDKAGITFGGFVNNKFGSEKWSAQMEMLFVDKGSRQQPNIERGIRYKEIKLSYVEVPVIAKVQHKKLFYEAGLSYGILVRHSEYDESGELNNPTVFKKNEYAYNLGLSYFFTEKLSFNARFVRSILPVRDYSVFTRFGFFTVSGVGIFGGSYNTDLSYTLRYQFGTGEKQEKKEDEKEKNIINDILKIE